MQKYNSLELMLEYMPLKQNASQKERKHNKANNIGRGSNPLELILFGKTNNLLSILNQIKQDIEKRTDVSRCIIQKIDLHSCLIKSKVLQLKKWYLGDNQNIERRRSNLENRLDEFKKEIRQEKAQCWRDIILLNKEFRNWFKQYADLSSRAKIITGENGKDNKYLLG